MYRLILLISAFGAVANAGTLYLPAYPARVLVFDEAKGQIVDRIPLETGTPMSIRLSPTEYWFVRNRLPLVFAVQAASDPAVAHVLWNATVTRADANSAKSAELPSVYEA